MAQEQERRPRDQEPAPTNYEATSSPIPADDEKPAKKLDETSPLDSGALLDQPSVSQSPTPKTPDKTSKSPPEVDAATGKPEGSIGAGRNGSNGPKAETNSLLAKSARSTGKKPKNALDKPPLGLAQQPPAEKTLGLQPNGGPLDEKATSPAKEIDSPRSVANGGATATLAEGDGEATHGSEGLTEEEAASGTPSDCLQEASAAPSSLFAERDPKEVELFESFVNDGGTGTHAELATKEEEVERVNGLVLDIDRKVFQPKFGVTNYLDFAIRLLSELGVRQTSPEGNLHGVVELLRASEAVRDCKDLHLRLRVGLLADPNQSLVLCKARVAGSKSKHDGYLIQEVKPAKRVGLRALKSTFASANLVSNMLGALLRALPAANGKSCWDGKSSHCICPIHGSGASRKVSARRSTSRRRACAC